MQAFIRGIRDHYPTFGKGCFFAHQAVIVGEVAMGDYCSVWFHAVVRGDVNSIVIGDYTNIQDGAIIHGTYRRAKTSIGDRVSIAHRAIVHGCTIHNKVLVGMGSIIMDHAQLGEGSIIAAGSVVLPDTRVEKHSVYAGVPARRVKDTSLELRQMIERTATNYPMYAEWYKEENNIQ